MKAKGNLVIWGASGHALVVADIVRLVGEHEIVGFLDDLHVERAGEPFGGASILGGSDKLSQLRSAGVSHALIGFGDWRRRLACAGTLVGAGFLLARALHPRAIIAGDALIGPGTVVAAGAVISPACRIGGNAIVNTSASVDHECEIADGAHIGPGARLAGGVHVGRGAWVGIGATITDRVRIGAASIVGAGAVVLADVSPGVVVYGVPARVVRTIDAG